MNKKQKRVLFISLVLISLAILARYLTADAGAVQNDAKYTKTSPSSFWAQESGFWDSIGAFISTPIPFIPPDDIIRFNSPDTVIRAKVTAYTSAIDETDDTPNVTASGTSTRDGICACPRWMAFGARISIGGKIYECFDRMNARFADRFDIFMPDKETALAWGVQEVEITISSSTP